MGPGRASAVIVFGGEGRNESEPTGALLTPWNLQAHILGDHVDYNATPISPSQLIIAAHTAAGLGSQAILGDSTYDIISTSDLPDSDLRVLTIDTHDGTTLMPIYAPLWNPDPAVDGSEIGKPIAIFGRGTQRGTAIYAALPTSDPMVPVPHGTSIMLTAGESAITGPVTTMPGELRGWATGVDDRVASWGENVVDDIVPIEDGGKNDGDTLAFSFSNDASAVANEATLSGGDSGGGVFIFSKGVWKLAGVNFSIDGNWSYTDQGPYFAGAIFDARGLYLGIPASNELVPYDLGPVAADSYASRIGSHLDELESLTGLNYDLETGRTIVPEPATTAVCLLGLACFRRRRRG